MRTVKKILNSAYKRKNTFFGSGFSVEKSYGCKWLIDWSNSVDKKMTFKLFEDEQISFFIKSFEKYKPEYFLDVGAHGGLYSIILKKSFPELNVLSFEPDPQNRYQFYGNLFLNSLEKKIKVFDFGLSRKESEVFFGIQKEGNRGGKTIQQSGKEKIIVKPLDKIINFKNKKCFIKIDVEGHECQVIEGAKEFLKKNSCLIQVELWNKDSFNRFNEIIKKYGYNNFIKHQNIEDYYFRNFS